MQLHKMPVNNRKSVSGFSLIELLVAMGIIAVLLALVAFGISIAQRNSRDTQRRQIGKDVEVKMADIYNIYGRYPLSEDRGDLLGYPNDQNYAVGYFAVGSAPVAYPDQIRISIMGIGSDSVPLKGAQRRSGLTDTGSTQYCYCAPPSGGRYVFGVRLEANMNPANNTTGWVFYGPDQRIKNINNCYISTADTGSGKSC